MPLPRHTVAFGAHPYVSVVWQIKLLVFSCLLFTLLSFKPAHADDAAVLPKGFSMLRADAQFYLPWNKKFNSNGDSEALGAEFNQNLNASLFPSLAAFGPGASLGRSVVDLERTGNVVVFTPAYGITDRFTIGANITYYRAKTTVGASIDSSSATVRQLNAAKSGANPCGLVPAATPGSRAVDIHDVNCVLSSQGFRPIQDDLNEGFGDIEVGGKYQYYRGRDFRASFIGGLRLPTGFHDDPNNFVDFGLGNGVYALLFQFQQDLMFQKEGLGKRLGFPDPGEFFINTTARYDLNLPDKTAARVCNVNLPVCSSFDPDARRDLGDRVEAEISAKIGLLIKGLNISPLYKYGHKFKDHYTGDRGFDYGILAQNSDQTEHVYVVALQFTTIPYFVEKTFPYPLAATVSYRSRFAGDNRLAKNEYIGFNFQAFF